MLLRLPEKYSFTLSKLRFFGLRKPKNSSFYPTPYKVGDPFQTKMGHPHVLEFNYYVTAFAAFGACVMKNELAVDAPHEPCHFFGFF